MWLHGSGNERGKELIPTRKGCLQKNLTENITKKKHVVVRPEGVSIPLPLG